MSTACPWGGMRQCRRTTTTLALLSLLCVVLLSLGPSGDIGLPASAPTGSGAALRRCGPHVLFAAAASGLPQCAQLQDQSNFGVNLNLFSANNVYLNGEYFCADTAPAQYHCHCSVATACKKKSDPWGRNMGSCECCPPWMIACFVILGVFFIVCIMGSLYVTVCQGRWWCDGYATPKTSLMPRRGPAVSCPPTRPLPQNLFRGYVSADFVNVSATPAGDTASTAAASAVQPTPSRGSAAAGESAAFGHDEGEERLPMMQPHLHSQRPPRVRASAGYPSSASPAPSQ